MDHVKECVLENRINFVYKVANVLGISDWSVQKYFKSQSEDASDCHQICAPTTE